MQATSQVERATTLSLAVWAALAAAVVVMPLRGRTVYSMTPPSDNGIITLPSQHSVDQTVERLTALLHAKGVTLFALVDHSGEAAKVGMKLSPTKLVIFGNQDRKSTRLNSSHLVISYAVFCLKKKKKSR